MTLENRKSDKANKRGFAIILVAGLAAMVLLLGVSLVSFMQVESAILGHDQRMNLARDNARMALDMAVGDLQRYAGQDKAVTALADIYRGTADESFQDKSNPADIFEPFWTGVWEDGATNPEWLVTRPIAPSGGVSALVYADLGISGNSVILVGDRSAEFEGAAGTQGDYNVEVPVEPILADGLLNLGTATVGNYAYWVGDLGVKASMALGNRTMEVSHGDYGVDDDADESTPTSFQKRLEQMYGNFYDIGLFDPESDENVPLVKSFVSDFQLRDTDENNPYAHFDGLTMNETLDSFHIYTPLARGVLSDSLNGGLKRDLSYIDPLNPVAFTGDSVVDGQLAGYIDVASMPITVDSALERSYDIQDSNLRIAPILTEFHVNFAFSVNSSGLLEVHYNGFFELWNPYTSRLNPDQLSITVGNLPALDIEYTSGGTIVATHSDVSFASLLPSNLFTLPPPATGEDWWRPGQIMAFSGDDTLVAYSGNTGQKKVTVGAATVAAFVDGTPANSGDDQIRVDADDSSYVSVLLRNSAGDLIGVYGISSSSSSFNTGGMSMSDTFADFGFTWAFDAPSTSSLFWSTTDIRSDPLVPSSSEFSGWESSPMDKKSHGPDEGTDVFFRSNPVDSSSTIDVSFDKPLFELPRQDILSIASLQNTYLGAPYGVRQIGRQGTTDSLNSLFDRFFFSTVPQVDASVNPWTVSDPLPNTRMEVLSNTAIGDLRSVNTASHLLVNGAFNINSTSIEAWVAVLGSVRLDTWDYVYDVATATKDFGGGAVFPIYAQSAEETWQGGYLDGFGEVNDPATVQEIEQMAYRLGLIEVTDAQIGDMAKDIVESIRTKMSDDDRPFINLSEFIDAGVINDAIDATGDDSLANAINYGKSLEQPGFLTQSDVLTAIAPFLSARSDTFLVRTYGDSVDPRDSAKVWARAYCEAIVQRMPSKHSTDTSTGGAITPTSTGNGEFGRQFKIIAFRWMDANEI